MNDEIIGQGREAAAYGQQRSGGRDYLWFALFLIVVLVGVAGH